MKIDFELKPIFLGNNVNTDLIQSPSKFVIKKDDSISNLVIDKSVNKVLVAQKCLGIGSSRLSTILALLNENFKCAIALSYSRIFERNLASVGIFPINLYDDLKIEKQLKKISKNCSNVYISINNEDKKLPTINVNIDFLYNDVKISCLGYIEKLFFEIAKCGGMVNFLRK